MTTPLAERVVADLWREFFAPPPQITVTEWAERHRRLAHGESAEPGPYRVARTPYAREPQDAMSARSRVEEVVLMWASQTGKTTVMLNCLGAAIGTNPGPIMVVWPTKNVATRNSRQRIAPLINESPQLRARVAANRSRDKANTTLLKEFEGGMLLIVGANSAADLRSTPARDLYLDEVDNFPLDVDGEGDPSKLAEARQTTFARRKRLRTSTPTSKGYSRIEEAYEASDRCRYHVPCPHCGAYQPLEFGADKGAAHGLQWERDADGAPIAATVRYRCAAAGCAIREHHKQTMLARGAWAAAAPGAQGGRVRGFHLNGLYSPLGWLSWREIATEWHKAQQAAGRGDVTLLRVFVNTRLAEAFEEQGDRADEHELKRRAQDIPLRIVLPQLHACTIAVDVQGDRVEAFLWAWGRGLERQLVDRAVFYGDPAQDESMPASPWAALTQYIRQPITGAEGVLRPLLGAFIDSGNGHHTQAIYAYCRAHQSEGVEACKGHSRPAKPLPLLGKPSLQTVNFRGTVVRRGVRLWMIGVDAGKQEVYGRLRVSQPGPGYVHLSRRLPAEVFEQITAERLVTRYVRGRARLEWIKPPGRRNEALDGAVMALAAAHRAGLDRWQEAEWGARERIVAEQAARMRQGKPARPPAAQDAPAAQPDGRISLAGAARFRKPGAG